MFTPRNVRIGGRRTSIRLEPELWEALERICDARNQTIDAACTAAAQEKGPTQNATSAIRSYIVRNLYAVDCPHGRCLLRQPSRPHLALTGA